MSTLVLIAAVLGIISGLFYMGDYRWVSGMLAGAAIALALEAVVLFGAAAMFVNDILKGMRP